MKASYDLPLPYRTLARDLLIRSARSGDPVILVPSSGAPRVMQMQASGTSFWKEVATMLLQRISPEFPITRLRDEFDRFFDDFRELPGELGMRFLGRPGFPAVNLWEDNQNLYAEAEVPGMKMSDLEVFVLNDELTIKGERPERIEEGTSFHRRERGTGKFSRVIRLPFEVDANRVEATLRDGVLTVRLPKSAAVLPRKIEVKS
jgi:HSP20 family protein